MLDAKETERQQKVEAEQQKKKHDQEKPKLQIELEYQRNSDQNFGTARQKEYEDDEQRVSRNRSRAEIPSHQLHKYIWQRSFAFVVDSSISIGLATALGIIVYRLQEGSYAAPFSSWITAIFFVFLYHILFEISPARATIGKLIFGLKVTDLHGRRIGFFRSLLRFAIKSGSIASWGIGIIYLVIALISLKKKQGIHDLITGSVVVIKEK